MIKVLRILTRPNLGGPSRQALALGLQDEATGLQTVLLVGQCAPGEAALDLSALGRLSADSLGSESRGVLHVDGLGRAARPWRDFLAVRRLRQLIRRWRPDVVHTHTSQAGLFGRRAAWAEKVPVIAHTFHGHLLRDYYSSPFSALLRRMERRLAARSDLLFCISESCRQELRDLGVGGQRLQVLPPAVDLVGFQAAKRPTARRRLGLAEGEKAIGFVGRLVPVKRPELFVKLVCALPEAQGLLFGGGALLPRLQAGAPKNLRFLGAEEKLESLLCGLDALVLCSRREGCPLVALEASAAGVPVVGLAVPGVEDVLGPWGAGVLVPEAEGVEGLVRAIRDLFSSQEQAETLVRRAREGLWRFAPEAVARELRRQYEAVLDAQSHGSSNGP